MSRGVRRRRFETPTVLVRLGAVSVRVTSMIEGFGLLQFLDTSWGETSLCALGFDTSVDHWAGVRASSEVPGLASLSVEIGDDPATFSTDSPRGRLRETWERLSESSYRWSREVEANGSWSEVLVAELTRTEAPST